MSDTTRIVYGKSSVARDDRHERALGERPVADVTALGAAHEAGLAHRERREVVVVPVELLRLEPEGVEPHLLLQRAERGDGQRLRLAAREERRAVRARRDADLDRDRADLALAAAVGALLLDGDALADDRLLERGRTRAARAGGTRRRSRPRGRRSTARGRPPRRPSSRPGARACRRPAWPRRAAAPWLARICLEQALVDLRRLDRRASPCRPSRPARAGAAQSFLICVVRDVERVEDLGLGDLVGARLDHEDRVLGAGDDEVEVGAVERGRSSGGLTTKLPSTLPMRTAPTGVGSGTVGDHQRRGGAVHREDVVGVHVVDAQRHAPRAASRSASPSGRAGGSGGRSCARSACPSRRRDPRA